MTTEEIRKAQAIEHEHIIRTHEKRAKKAIIADKIAELIAEGIDETTAKIMAKTFYEYGI